jgi:hypothetical protein|tara:strand:+ start:754 stop:1506 length:753 start_codon:yes stop_codon:yes gene_type:complete
MDIDAIRKRLNQLQTSNNRTSNLWRPQPGKQQIRVVPYKHDKTNPFIELFFHYGLGERSYLSPISFGRPDPIEEFANKLKASGNKDDYQLSKKLSAKMRTFAPVIVRGEENEGVKFWGFGKMVYQELLSVIADPDYGDITDPMTGRDVVVEFISAEDTGKSFPTTNVRVKPNQTPITEDKALLETTLENQSDITEVYKELSYDDLTEVLNNWLSDTPEEGGEDKADEPNEVVSKATVTDTTEAFDALFNR